VPNGIGFFIAHPGASKRRSRALPSAAK